MRGRTLVAALCAFLRPTACFLAPGVLRLRGGSGLAARATVATATDPTTATDHATADPPLPLVLTLVAGAEGAVTNLPRVELSAGNVEALRLKPGDRVQLSRTKRRAFKPFWTVIPDHTLGEVIQEPSLGEGAVRMPEKAMRAMKLDIGETVQIEAIKQPAAAVTERTSAPRRRGSFSNSILRMHLYRALLAPPPMYYHGGYRGGRRYSYRSGARRAYGGSRRRR